MGRASREVWIKRVKRWRDSGLSAKECIRSANRVRFARPCELLTADSLDLRVDSARSVTTRFAEGYAALDAAC